MSDPVLSRWYRDYNKKYFLGALPEPDAVRIFYGPCFKEFRQYGRTMGFEQDAVEWDMHLDELLEEHEPFAKLTLLHEMVHIKRWPDRRHGELFRKEIEILVLKGAYKGLL